MKQILDILGRDQAICIILIGMRKGELRPRAPCMMGTSGISSTNRQCILYDKYADKEEIEWHLQS